jgi:glycine hydroxymethyltransferase
MDQINEAVFPSLQGGPHNHQIGALAVALKEASQPEFSAYAKQVVANAKALCEGLQRRGHTLATGGTDNHLVLWDVRPLGLTGSKLDKVLGEINITANKNSLHGDVSAINPGGVRLGTPALTTRGLVETDFEKVAKYLHRGCDIALQVQQIAQLEVDADLASDNRKSNKVLLKDFENVLSTNEEIIRSIKALKDEVEEFSLSFYMPGSD